MPPRPDAYRGETQEIMSQLLSREIIDRVRPLANLGSTNPIHGALDASVADEVVEWLVGKLGRDLLGTLTNLSNGALSIQSARLDFERLEDRILPAVNDDIATWINIQKVIYAIRLQIDTAAVIIKAILDERVDAKIPPELESERARWAERIEKLRAGDLPMPEVEGGPIGEETQAGEEIRAWIDERDGKPDSIWKKLLRVFSRYPLGTRLTWIQLGREAGIREQQIGNGMSVIRGLQYGSSFPFQLCDDNRSPREYWVERKGEE